MMVMILLCFSKNKRSRPIKLEPNKTSTSKVQKSVLSLYDSSRAKNPMKSGVESDWNTVDLRFQKNLMKFLP